MIQPIPLPDSLPREKKAYVHTNTSTGGEVHSSIIRNSLNVETMQMFTNRCMDQQRGVYSFNGILGNKKNKLLSATM